MVHGLEHEIFTDIFTVSIQMIAGIIVGQIN